MGKTEDDGLGQGIFIERAVIGKLAAESRAKFPRPVDASIDRDQKILTMMGGRRKDEGQRQ